MVHGIDHRGGGICIGYAFGCIPVCGKSIGFWILDAGLTGGSTYILVY
jgi:hypothetical protein